MEISKTEDLWFAVYVFHKGIDPIEIRDIGSRKLFVFKEDNIFRKMKKEYYQDEARINPRRYKWGFRRLKAIISN